MLVEREQKNQKRTVSLHTVKTTQKNTLFGRLPQEDIVANRIDAI